MDQEIIVFWDSIVHWLYGEEGISWCDLLKKMVQRFPWSLVYNLWIPGDTTNGVLLRFEHEISCRWHDIVIFAIGINDTRYIEREEDGETPINVFSNNIQKLIDMSLKHTDKVVFIGMTRINPEIEQLWPNFFSNRTIERYDRMMKEILKKNNIPFIEVADCVNPIDLSDGLHPNQKGQEKIFRKVSEELVKLGFIQPRKLMD